MLLVRPPPPPPRFPPPVLPPLPRLKLLPPPVAPVPCLLSPPVSLLINISLLPVSFFSIGIRFLFFFSSFTGLVSLSTGKSIFPRIFGPVNFSTSIFSITAGWSSATVWGETELSASFFSTTGRASSFFPFFALPLTNFSSSAGFVSSTPSGKSSFFPLIIFFGRVEESIVERSIFFTTFGLSISGASIFVTSSFLASSTFGATIASGVPSSTGFITSSFFTILGASFSSFLKLISSSSFFFLASAWEPLGNSSWSLFIFAALSPENSCCNERYISSVSFDVGFSSSLGKFFAIRKSIIVS